MLSGDPGNSSILFSVLMMRRRMVRRNQDGYPCVQIVNVYGLGMEALCIGYKYAVQIISM